MKFATYFHFMTYLAQYGNTLLYKNLLVFSMVISTHCLFYPIFALTYLVVAVLESGPVGWVDHEHLAGLHGLTNWVITWFPLLSCTLLLLSARHACIFMCLQHHIHGITIFIFCDSETHFVDSFIGSTTSVFYCKMFYKAKIGL